VLIYLDFGRPLSASCLSRRLYVHVHRTEHRRGFKSPTDAAEPDDENRKRASLLVDPEPEKIGVRAEAADPVFSGRRVIPTGHKGSRRRFSKRSEGTRIPEGYEGQVDWGALLFGYFLLGKQEKVTCCRLPNNVRVCPRVQPPANRFSARRRRYILD
jgi:hypothetical protein